MERILKKIYEEVICQEEDVKKANRIIENEIMHMVEIYKDSLGNEEKEKLLDLLDTAASFAECQGFYLGVRYAMKGMVILLKE